MTNRYHPCRSPIHLFMVCVYLQISRLSSSMSAESSNVMTASAPTTVAPATSNNNNNNSNSSNVPTASRLRHVLGHIPAAIGNIGNVVASFMSSSSPDSSKVDTLTPIYIYLIYDLRKSSLTITPTFHHKGHKQLI
jgi:hypothetical protein